MSINQDMEIVLEDQFHILSEEKEVLGITLEDNILRKAEIVHCLVVSEATGQVLERNHVYGWSYDTILDTGIWQLIFHKIF